MHAGMSGVHVDRARTRRAGIYGGARHGDALRRPHRGRRAGAGALQQVAELYILLHHDCFYPFVLPTVSFGLHGRVLRWCACQGELLNIHIICRGSGGMSRVALGSVKSCYGHTEGTAGLTGALLAMQTLSQQVLCLALHDVRAWQTARYTLLVLLTVQVLIPGCALKLLQY